MSRLFVMGMIGMLILNACQKNATNEKRLEEIQPGTGVSDIIRNPVTADGMTDSTNVAKMTFLETEFNFGEIKEGEQIEHIFPFTNTGKVPLIISDARSTCGCTVPEWSKEPIPSGESGEIKVRFNSTNKTGRQNKPVTITANTYPAETVVHMNGLVREK